MTLFALEQLLTSFIRLLADTVEDKPIDMLEEMIAAGDSVVVTLEL